MKVNRVTRVWEDRSVWEHARRCGGAGGTQPDPEEASSILSICFVCRQSRLSQFAATNNSNNNNNNNNNININNNNNTNPCLGIEVGARVVENLVRKTPPHPQHVIPPPQS